jgi:hypothetical protein
LAALALAALELVGSSAVDCRASASGAADGNRFSVGCVDRLAHTGSTSSAAPRRCGSSCSAPA